jgi:hypothetical protein
MLDAMTCAHPVHRIRLREAPRWVRTWMKVHRMAGMMLGLHFLPDPMKWLEHHGYVDEWPW